MSDRVPCPACDGGVVRPDPSDPARIELCKVCKGAPDVALKGLSETIFNAKKAE